jgi:hypothetical protein
MNRLYFGDNLKWLSDRKEFPDASVDLVYLDPPFNSNAADTYHQRQLPMLYTSEVWHDKDYPRIQILTVEGLINGTERIDTPPQLNPFALAAREQSSTNSRRC